MLRTCIRVGDIRALLTTLLTEVKRNSEHLYGINNIHVLNIYILTLYVLSMYVLNIYPWNVGYVVKWF